MEIPLIYTGENIRTNLIGTHQKKIIEENSPKLKKDLNLKNKLFL